MNRPYEVNKSTCGVKDVQNEEGYCCLPFEHTFKEHIYLPNQQDNYFLNVPAMRQQDNLLLSYGKLGCSVAVNIQGLIYIILLNIIPDLFYHFIIPHTLYSCRYILPFLNTSCGNFVCK